MTLTALQLARKVLEENGFPMSSEDIWAYAVERGYDKETDLKGKTPWRSIGARLYMDMKSGASCFIQASSRPPKFGIRGMEYSGESLTELEETSAINTLKERDLHQFLVAYVAANAHFKAHTKTIHHELSTKSTKNARMWMHPDLVSVRLPFEELSKETMALADCAGMNTFTIYSFEMKMELTSSDVRQYYFQAVSNSSWANEGYLVAPRITDDALNQLSKLNSSFGIGVIRLDIEDPYQSEILLPAVERELDLGMVDDLTRINSDFAEFVSSIIDSMQIKKYTGKFDKILDID